MQTSLVLYNGELRTTCTHLRSQTSIITDAPIDNRGRGEAFSPTDLLATSLAACILTTAGIWASDHGLTIDGSSAEVTKVMAAAPRRVSEVAVRVVYTGVFSPEQKEKLIHIAHTCPVALSLHPDLKQKIDVVFQKPSVVG